MNWLVWWLVSFFCTLGIELLSLVSRLVPGAQALIRQQRHPPSGSKGRFARHPGSVGSVSTAVVAPHQSALDFRPTRFLEKRFVPGRRGKKTPTSPRNSKKTPTPGKTHSGWHAG